MTKSEYQRYLSSPHWLQLRKEFLEYCGQVCWHCYIPRWLAVIAYDQDLHVHHLSYADLGSEDWSDLEPLCRRCHEVKTFGKSSLKAPWSKRCATEECENSIYDPYQTSDLCWHCGILETYLAGRDFKPKVRSSDFDADKVPF